VADEIVGGCGGFVNRIVVAAGLIRCAVAEKVHGDHVVVGGQVGGHLCVVVGPRRKPVQQKHRGPRPAPPECDAMSAAADQGVVFGDPCGCPGGTCRPSHRSSSLGIA